jgi:hypothetical protein
MQVRGRNAEGRTLNSKTVLAVFYPKRLYGGEPVYSLCYYLLLFSVPTENFSRIAFEQQIDGLCGFDKKCSERISVHKPFQAFLSKTVLCWLCWCHASA